MWKKIKIGLIYSLILTLKVTITSILIIGLYSKKYDIIFPIKIAIPLFIAIFIFDRVIDFHNQIFWKIYISKYLC